MSRLVDRVAHTVVVPSVVTAALYALLVLGIDGPSEGSSHAPIVYIFIESSAHDMLLSPCADLKRLLPSAVTAIDRTFPA